MDLHALLLGGLGWLESQLQIGSPYRVALPYAYSVFPGAKMKTLVVASCRVLWVELREAAWSIVRNDLCQEPARMMVAPPAVCRPDVYFPTTERAAEYRVQGCGFGQYLQVAYCISKR
ncbi:hypothetical protein BDW66DRAFT_133773 [Aspergillus desertorum]